MVENHTLDGRLPPESQQFVSVVPEEAGGVPHLCAEILLLAHHDTEA